MKTSNSLILAVGVLLAGFSAAHADVSVYISKPGTQLFQASDFLVANGGDFHREGFEPNFTFGSTSLNGGVYTATAPDPAASLIINPNADMAQYGGTWAAPGVPAAGADERFLAINNPAHIVTITFAQPINYFGLFWTAGSDGNRITLYNADNVSLGTYDTTALQALLPKDENAKIAAISGYEYDAIDFYGQPVTGAGLPVNGDTQLFAYLHFINNGGDPANSIAKIVLEQGAGGGFESDNHTTSTVAPVVGPENPNIILVAQVVPEPSTYLLFGSAAAGLLWLKRRRARSAK